MKDRPFLASTLLLVFFSLPTPFSMSAGRSSQPWLPYEDEVTQSYGDGLRAAREKASLTPTERLKSALDIVSPVVKKQNVALSIPRSRARGLMSPLAPRFERKTRYVEVSPAAPIPELPARREEPAPLDVIPPDFPSLMVFEKGKPIHVENERRDVPPEQIEFPGKRK